MKFKRFENLWMKNPDINNIIYQSWNSSFNQDTKHKLNYTLNSLWDWESPSLPTPLKKLSSLVNSVKDCRTTIIKIRTTSC